MRVLLLFLLFIIKIEVYFSSESKNNKEDNNDINNNDCVHQYALYAREESISFLESLVKPITLEKLLVDILQKQPAVARRQNPNYYGQLLNIDDINTILQNGRKQENPKKKIKYLEDWKLVKRTFSDGEWWTGVFNKSNITIKDAQDAFSKGGFTIIIKEMQSLWSSIHHVAWLLEAALGWRVNVNLYMSPAGSQGFEAHYDWMDGFIFQMYGKKNWTIYDPPLAVYPRPDHSKRPTPEFLAFAKQEYLKDSSQQQQQQQQQQPKNLPPQEFILSAGDLVYIPRGIVHEATATIPSSNEEDDLSLHLTFGIETATHYSVEIFLHHFIKLRSLNVLTNKIPLITPSIINSSNLLFSLSNDENNVNLFLYKSEGTLEDLFHLLLSGVSSYGPPRLRGALAVTILLIDVPLMNPYHLFPYVVNDFMISFHIPTLLKFFIQRGFLRLFISLPINENFDENNNENNSNVVNIILNPGIESSQNVYSSADFTCSYLNEFFSNKFQTTHRMISLNLTNYFIERKLNWKDYLVDNNDKIDGTEIKNNFQYNRTKVIQLIESIENWSTTEKLLKDIITEIYNSKANNLNRTEQEEDEMFCETWKEMIVSVKKEKLERKKKQGEALKLSGQKLREKESQQQQQQQQQSSSSSKKTQKTQKPQKSNYKLEDLVNDEL